MQACELVLTDSGGVQEEAPGLANVLVMRDIENRTARSVDRRHRPARRPRPSKNRRRVTELTPPTATVTRDGPSRSNPYGDGNASKRILDANRQLLSRPSKRMPKRSKLRNQLS